MPFRVLAGLAAVTGFVSLIAGYVPGTIVAGGVLVYLVSLLIGPVRRCISCKGSGTHPDPLRSGGERRCWTCRGRKVYPRWGTMVLRPQVARKIAAGEHGRNY